MKKSFLNLLVITALLLPASALAVSPSVSILAPTRAVMAGDTIIMPVMLNIPETIGINVFQARVAVSGPAHLVRILTGGSVFTFWPEVPIVASDTVAFLGGTPGSIYGSPLRAIMLVISATSIGKVKVNITAATAYAGDGKGTAQPLKDSETSFAVGPKTALPRNEFSDFIAKDLTPPDPFITVLGRDPSFYNNLYFISFATSDADSGVSRYEVSENGGPWVLATSTYMILSDQSLAGSVTVRAVDAAGNVRTETLLLAPGNWNGFIWAGIMLLVVCSFIAVSVNKRRHKKY